jgi:hypothetical protein
MQAESLAALRWLGQLMAGGAAAAAGGPQHRRAGPQWGGAHARARPPAPDAPKAEELEQEKEQERGELRHSLSVEVSQFCAALLRCARIDGALAYDCLPAWTRRRPP